LKLHVSTFHTFYTSKPSTVQAVKFPTILDSFYLVLTVSGELQYGQVVGGKMVVLKNEIRKCMVELGKVIAIQWLKMKEIYSMELY